MAQFSVAAAYNITYAPYVSDYSRYMPRKTSPRGIIAAVFFGASGSAIWLIALGAWLATRLNISDGLVGLQVAGDNVAAPLGSITAFLSATALLATMGMNAYGGMLTVLTGIDSFKTDPNEADVAVVGIPFDSGISYRPGARFGPSHIRESSRLAERARAVLTLGGDHTVALPMLRAVAPGTARWPWSTSTRRRPRSRTSAWLAWWNASGTGSASGRCTSRSTSTCSTRRTHPAPAPPEAGGLTSRELLATLRSFARPNLVGADIVEVAPAYDHAQITGIAAANVGYELLSAFAARSRPASGPA